MVNDGGEEDFIPHLARQYGPRRDLKDASSLINGSSRHWTAPGIEYEYLNKTGSNGVALYFDSYEANVGLIERLIKTALKSDAEWVMILEDDVWLFDVVDTGNLNFDLSGAPPWTSLTEHSFAILKILMGHDPPSRRVSGCGGTFIRSEILRKLNDMTETWHEWVRRMFEYKHARESTWASDELISVLVHLMNGTSGVFDPYIEPTYGSWQTKLLTGEAYVLHGGKAYYH